MGIGHWELIQTSFFITFETALLIQLINHSFLDPKHFNSLVLTTVLSFLQLIQRIICYNIGIPSLILSLSLDFLVIWMGFEGSIINKIFVVLVFYAFSIIFDAATNIILLFISTPFFPQAVTSELYIFINTMLSKLMLMVAILFVKNTLKLDNSLIALIKYLPLPVVTLLFLLWGSPFTREVNAETIGLLAMICVFCILANLYFIISIHQTNEKLQLAYHLELLTESKKLAREHYTAMQASYQKIERTAHDISHHLNYIAGANNIETIHQYVQKLKECSFSQIKSFTGNFDIDVVLNAKIISMRNAEIKLKVSGILPHEIEWLDSIDVSIILGNAISNATESCIRCDGHSVDVTFKYDKDWLVLSIVNPVSELPIPKKAGFGFVSSKRGLHHGIGMESMAEAVERYEGTIKYSSEDGFFRLDILLQRNN